jgi:hypothetical protein
MSRRSRIAMGVGSLVAACAVYLWFFGLQTFSMVEARSLARKQPLVMVLPAELSDLSISQAPGRKLSYFGYEFDIPWGDLDEDKTRVIEDKGPLAVAMMVFRSGNVIAFWSSALNEVISYNSQRAILEATPDDFSLLTPKKQAIDERILLTMKAEIVGRDAEFGIYLVKTSEFRGFQYGRPQDPPKRLRTELFGKDRCLKILFGQKPNGSVIISQPDINRIVQSIHKLPTEQAGANAGF